MANFETATFAGGCFWCMEPLFDKLEGVEKTVVGYTGGQEFNPTYEMVSSGKTGHVEAIEIYYNPEKISYKQLLETFWKNVDPTAKDRQFCDIGRQYRSVIFYRNEEEKKLALSSKENILKLGVVPVVNTEIVPAGKFYPAEENHQDFYRKNPLRYKFYHTASGREKRLIDIWGNFSKFF